MQAADPDCTPWFLAHSISPPMLTGQEHMRHRGWQAQDHVWWWMRSQKGQSLQVSAGSKENTWNSWIISPLVKALLLLDHKRYGFYTSERGAICNIIHVCPISLLVFLRLRLFVLPYTGESPSCYQSDKHTGGYKAALISPLSLYKPSAASREQN